MSVKRKDDFECVKQPGVAYAAQRKRERLTQSRLARECAKLDPEAERRMAEEGMSEEAAAWPEY